MSPRPVIAGVTIALCIVYVADLCAQRLASNSVPRQVIRTIASARTDIDVLGMGNSLMAAGFDPVAYEERCAEVARQCTAVNGALGATGVIEHLELTRLALRSHSVKTEVYGFFDFQLASEGASKNADLLGNRNVLYYLEPELTLKYARFDALDSWLFRLYSKSALLTERGTIWSKVEGLRRSMASVGMPAQEVNRFGRAADFARLEAQDTDAFDVSCEESLHSGHFLGGPMLALLRHAKAQGTKVLIVEMPMHPQHLEKFYKRSLWGEFRRNTQTTLEGAGASYLNASTWIPDGRMFDDPLHLSAAGARAFSRHLAEYISASGAEPNR